MAGERTPDTTPQNYKGSSDDEISLREHLQRQVDALERQMGRRFEQEHAYSVDMRAEMDLRYQQRFEAQQIALKDALAAAREAVAAALAAADRAVQKAENAAEKRFESVNEFRATLSDQARDQMPRAEANAKFEAQDQRIEALTKIIDRQEGAKQGTVDLRAWVLAGVTLIVAAITIAGFVIANKP